MIARLCLIWLLSALVACSASHESASVPDAVDAPVVSSATENPLSVQLQPAEQTKGQSKAERDVAGEIDYSCRGDDDCAIKNVGSCCGYYPACVNLNSPTFPEQVKADCAASGRSSVCGFPSLSGCQCVEGRCEGVRSSGPGLEPMS